MDNIIFLALCPILGGSLGLNWYFYFNSTEWVRLNVSIHKLQQEIAAHEKRILVMKAQLRP